MPVARAREILGDEIADLTDVEVEGLIVETYGRMEHLVTAYELRVQSQSRGSTPAAKATRDARKQLVRNR